MKVLYWVNSFPSISETFIRDQIIHVHNHGIKVKIYSSRRKSNNNNESIAPDIFKTFSKYSYDSKDILPNNWKIRRLKIFIILLKSKFTRNHILYKEALRYKRHELFPKAYQLFFTVHFILKNKFDIIHCHFGNNGVQASFLKSIGLPLKLVVTFHGYDTRLDIQKAQELYFDLFKNVDKVISISTFSEKKLADFGLNNNKIVKLPNGIDTDYFNTNRKPQSGSEIKILSVGRLVLEKGYEIAFEAIKVFLEKNPDLTIRYNVIGEGELYNMLQEKINTLGLYNVVHLLGVKNTHEVREEMKRSDFFLLSSKKEVLPTVILEAQSCRLPVLSTNVGAINEMVQDAIIISPNNIKSMVHGLTLMLEKQHSWHLMGQHGRDLVRREFNISKNTKRLIKEVYAIE